MNKDVLMGAIIGDIVGSRFEIINNKTGKEFELFTENCRFTDDTVMTLAVAKTLMDSNCDLTKLKDNTIKSMTYFGKKYPKCGFGPSFYKWIMSDDHTPYESFGNGAAMRISPVGVYFKNKEDIIKATDIITSVSHNNIEALKGAEATSIAIRMALDNKSKEEIKEYINTNYFEIDNLRTDMKKSLFHINCIETVKQALQAFLISNNFEDAIRNAIALGGDSDTLASITGAISAAYYGVPKDLTNKAITYLDNNLLSIYDGFGFSKEN